MEKVLITGSGGLIGSAAAKYFAERKFQVFGIDNDMRAAFFGPEASVSSTIKHLHETIHGYKHVTANIRYSSQYEFLFREHKFDLIIHTAAQPSHDWASKDPIVDFDVNARATLLLLEMTRKYCPDAVFIHMSTNKVYGDRPNTEIGLQEGKKRYEIARHIPRAHLYEDGIDETMSIDYSMHSLFGCSKAAADLYVQEYGRYYRMKTTVFRGGCLTGENHKGAELHGFLSYLVKCGMTGKKYTIYGHRGKQVRDNIHAYDVCTAFHEVYKNPAVGAVFNIGGGTHSNCSILEAIDIIENISGKKVDYECVDTPRKGDHKWYISNMNRFKAVYHNWNHTFNIEQIITQIIKSYD